MLEFVHVQTGQTVIRASTHYSVPSELAEHIDFSELDLLLLRVFTLLQLQTSTASPKLVSPAPSLPSVITVCIRTYPTTCHTLQTATTRLE